MVNECGTVCGMRIDRGNRSTRRKPAPVPLCPPQIPRDLTWDLSVGYAVINTFLASVLDDSEWSELRSALFISWEISPGTRNTGMYVCMYVCMYV
jgi:hypothetical protein